MINELNVPFHNEYRPYVPAPDDTALCFREEGALLALENGEIRFPNVGEIGTVGPYLFSVGETRCFLGESPAFGAYRYHEPTLFRAAGPRPAAFAGVTALHLYRWYADNRFCGRCGKEMRHSETERAMCCACGNTVYPKICPAVIVAVLRGGRICLTKYNRANARWALVAGYNEAGETVEETVRREVLEETGLRVTHLRYYKSQPWGLSGSLLFGFFCDADGDEPIRVDGAELKEARWFAPEEIDFTDDGFSLTREMTEAFRTGNFPG